MTVSDESFDYSATLLPDFLSKDLWSEVEACKLLADLDPQPRRNERDCARYSIPSLRTGQPAERAQIERFERILDTWRGSDHSAWLGNERNPFALDTAGRRKFTIDYFVDWAIGRRIEIPWLDWAEGKGYLGRKHPLGTAGGPNIMVIDLDAPYLSQRLIDLIEAAEAVWNPDRHKKGERKPKNSDVVAFLVGKRGWERTTLVEAAATIVRPAQAPRGRPKKSGKKSS